MVNDINKLSHTQWNCKYHIVFAPKYRRRFFYKEKKTEVGKNAKRIAEYIQNQLKIDEAGSQLPFDNSPLVVKERK